MSDSTNLDRRRFLQSAAAVAIALPVLDGFPSPAEAASSSNTIDVGTLRSYGKDVVNDTWAHSNRIFVMVQQGKLYAPSATCTHKGCLLRKTPEFLYCHCHRSEFTFEGHPISGPAKFPLPRYAISVNNSGDVVVDKAHSFDEPQWSDPASFIEVGKATK